MKFPGYIVSRIYILELCFLSKDPCPPKFKDQFARWTVGIWKLTFQRSMQFSYSLNLTIFSKLILMGSLEACLFVLSYTRTFFLVIDLFIFTDYSFLIYMFSFIFIFIYDKWNIFKQLYFILDLKWTLSIKLQIWTLKQNIVLVKIKFSFFKRCLCVNGPSEKISVFFSTKSRFYIHSIQVVYMFLF